MSNWIPHLFLPRKNVVAFLVFKVTNENSLFLNSQFLFIFHSNSCSLRQFLEFYNEIFRNCVLGRSSTDKASKF